MLNCIDVAVTLAQFFNDLSLTAKSIYPLKKRLTSLGPNSAGITVSKLPKGALEICLEKCFLQNSCLL